MKISFIAIIFSIIHFQSFAQNDFIELDIPMRDGQTLAGDLYLPNNTGDFPTILIMTPYGKLFYRFSGLPLGIEQNIDQSEYAVLVVDWRCRFASLSACAVGSNDGEDGYDVVEWIADQDWSNGKIGMWGPSALGNIQFQTARQKPPHLICSVPEVAGPHLSFNKYYPGGVLTSERLETLATLFPGSFDLVVQNPHYNLLWTIAENSSMYPEDIEVPMLLIGGWYDINLDQTIYLSDTLRSTSPLSNQHKTLIGPWVHGGTGEAVVGSSIQGELEYPNAENFNTLFALEFFDYHLRDIDNDWNARDRYTYFLMGSNEWLSSPIWPPSNLNQVSYYLQEDLSLDKLMPSSNSAALNYNYDPHDPSPTIGGKTLNLNLDQGPYDQSIEVETRNDNLTFTSAVFENDLKIIGTVKINLFVSSDRSDTDFAVRLTEVYPDGRSMLISDQIQRMRYRNGNGLNDVSFMENGEIYNIQLALEDLAITIKAGHQIRLIISSSNYPRYNRNMNTGDEMYPNNNIDTLVQPVVALNSIHLNSIYPSNISIPYMTNTPLFIDENDNVAEVKIFQNPVIDQLRLKSSLLIDGIKIYDQSGKMCISKPINSKEVKLNVTNLNEGIYVLRLIFKNNTLDHQEKIMIVEK